MAKMTIDFDTVSKKLVAAIDGQEVEHCVGVEVYPSWDDDDSFRCIFRTSSSDESSGIQEIRYLVASKSKDAVAAGENAKACKHQDFVEVTETKSGISEQISKFFKDKKQCR